MANNVQVTATQPYTYLDQNDRVVNGYRVYFLLAEFSENHFVDVPSLDPGVVKAAVEKVAKQRKDISTF